MRTLYDSINSQKVDEGLFKNAVSLIQLRKVSSQELLTGIMNMYDYICDGDNMDLFFQDMPTLERTLWKNLYELYQKKVWSIIDFSAKTFNNTPKRPNRAVRNNADDEESEFANDSDFEDIGSDLDTGSDLASDIFTELDLEENKLTKVTPQFRRALRNIIKQSKNPDIDLKPSEPDSILPIYDEQFDKGYFITLNRTTGLLNRLFRKADHKFLEKAFSKLGDDRESGSVDFEDDEA